MSAEYFVNDFDGYAKIFRQHAIYFAEFMKILDDEIISMGLPPVGRTKELFRMTMDLTYQTDRTYRAQNNLEDDEFKLTTYMSSDEVFNHMKTAFKEEFDRYMDIKNGTEE